MQTEWTEKRHESQYTSIHYDFRVTCDTHYYGGGCEVLCRPRDDQFGHYTCSSTGSIVCLAGWQGAYCTKGKLSNNLLLILMVMDINKKKNMKFCSSLKKCETFIMVIEM